MNGSSFKKSLPRTEPLSLDQWPTGAAQRAAAFLPMLRRVGDPLLALRSLYVQLSEQHKITCILARRTAPLLRNQRQAGRQSREWRTRNVSRGTGTEELPVLCSRSFPAQCRAEDSSSHGYHKIPGFAVGEGFAHSWNRKLE